MVGQQQQQWLGSSSSSNGQQQQAAVVSSSSSNSGWAAAGSGVSRAQAAPLTAHAPRTRTHARTPAAAHAQLHTHLRQEPAAQLVGAAVGEAEDVVGDGVAARRLLRPARGGLEVGLVQRQRALSHGVGAQALGARVVDALEHWGGGAGGGWEAGRRGTAAAREQPAAAAARERSLTPQPVHRKPLKLLNRNLPLRQVAVHAELHPRPRRPRAGPPSSARSGCGLGPGAHAARCQKVHRAALCLVIWGGQAGVQSAGGAAGDVLRFERSSRAREAGGWVQGARVRCTAAGRVPIPAVERCRAPWRAAAGGGASQHAQRAAAPFLRLGRAGPDPLALPPGAWGCGALP